jgi:hypothetical protein
VGKWKAHFSFPAFPSPASHQYIQADWNNLLIIYRCPIAWPRSSRTGLRPWGGWAMGGIPRTPCAQRLRLDGQSLRRRCLADHFPPRAHNQLMNTDLIREQSLCPSVPRSLSPSVPWSLSYPHPPLWKSASILHGFSRKTHGINQFTFLSVNYPVNFNPEKTPLSSPKGPALGAKTSLFRPFVALRLRPLDKCRPLAHPCGDWGETIPVWKGQLCAPSIPRSLRNGLKFKLPSAFS